MYLKEIKIVGFKSFAEKTTINLEKGITGVVGPNGSGKSNIVDAIRWVLGEQSVKSLRGEGMMADVIFSGSKSRNAQTMASVSLTFDNADKHLPVPYEEVQIKRTVYKTGENEYYLNNEKCRLKDITDLFIDSGAGKESLNIISQGKISEILSSKPEERRIIFEEAAGVLKYKKRKDEALRKLERTHDNMHRVKDIISELEEQINPLKEQSAKASEYLELSDNLKNIEIALITHDITAINYEYKKTKDQIEELTNNAMSLNTDESLATSEIETKKTEIQKLNDKIQQESQELVTLSAQKERLNGDKKVITERQQMSVNDHKLHDIILGLKEQEKDLLNEQALLNSQVKIKNDEMAANADKIKRLQDELTDLRNQRQTTSNRIANLTKEHINNNYRLEALEVSIESNSKLPAAVREVLNNPRLLGVHNTIGNLTLTKEEYSEAIQVALSGSKDFIVVDDEMKAKDAVNYLKNNRLGRATFFPLSVIKPKGIDEETMNLLAKETGYVNIAANLVTYQPIYRNIILNQLGNVIVVDNLDTANRISRKIQHRYKIVSLDGELVHVGGSITGGTLRLTNNIFKDKYEIERLRKEIINSRDIVANNEQALEKQNGQIFELETKLNDLLKDKMQITEDINNKMRSLQVVENTYHEIVSKLTNYNHENSLTNEELSIIEELTKCEQALAEKKMLVEAYYKQRTELAETVNELESDLKKRTQSYNRIQEELKKAEIASSKMEFKLDLLLQTLSEDYTMTFEKAASEYHLDIDEKDARNKVNFYKSMIKDLGTVNLGAIAEYERVSKRYDFLFKQQDDLVKAEDTLLSIIKEMDDIMKDKFKETFNIIKDKFKETFKELFGGGIGDLRLTDEDNILETGIDIIVSPPGKKLQHISLLSGGEKTLAAIALLFAILKARPVPFAILDEVEAALDEVNVDNFGKYLDNFRLSTQFIIITHKKKTMEYADVLYGVTMQESGVSKLVSVRLENIKE